MCYNEILNFFGEIPNLEKEETEKACFTVFYKIELWKFEKVFNDNILSVNDNVSRIRKKPSLIVQIFYQKFISKPSMEGHLAQILGQLNMWSAQVQKQNYLKNLVSVSCVYFEI